MSNNNQKIEYERYRTYEEQLGRISHQLEILKIKEDALESNNKLLEIFKEAEGLYKAQIKCLDEQIEEMKKERDEYKNEK